MIHHKLQKLMDAHPLILDAKNQKHVLVFRRMLEWSMCQGRWSGWMAEQS